MLIYTNLKYAALGREISGGGGGIISRKLIVYPQRSYVKLLKLVPHVKPYLRMKILSSYYLINNKYKFF